MALSGDADVLVIGAGPSGSLAGATLARRGRTVIALEREHFPRFVIGESQLPRSTVLLERAGLLDAVRARHFMIKHAATFWLGAEAARYRFADGLPGDPPLAFQTPRGPFDQVLATAARGHGVDVRFGHQVDAVEFLDDRVIVRATDLETAEPIDLQGRFLLDCGGFGRVLPRMLDLEAPPCLIPRTACFAMFEGDERPPGEAEGDIWVCVVPGLGWCWLIPFSDGRTSVGFLAETDRYDALPGPDRARLLAMLGTEPNAARRLRAARPVVPVRRLQGWTRIVTRMFGPRWAVVGNAGDFIDPIFSSGVMLAMESATLAAECVDRQLAGDRVDWLREYQEVIKGATDVFRTFVEAWYRGDLVRVLFATEQSDPVRRAITSVLGGNVLNRNNSLVRNGENGLRALVRALEHRGGAPRSTP